MRHVPYPKIPTARQLGSTTVGGSWVATEKIHGAQLVVAYDGHEVCVGKRKAWLGNDEPFFGWQLLRSNLEIAAKVAFARAGGTVRVYGELYGGRYPHPDVAPVPGATAVQTGVWYSPDIRFAIFDVLNQQRPKDSGTFRPYAEIAAIAAEAGVDVVPLLGVGARSVLDGLPVRFASRVPVARGLPELPNNLAEGIVLRPDSPLAPERRPMLKLKIEEFDEQRFGQSQPWDPHSRLDPAELAGIGRAMVNPARLASARSKVGMVPPEELVEEVVLDVMVDLTEAFPTAMSALLSAEEAALEALIRAAAGGA